MISNKLVGQNESFASNQVLPQGENELPLVNTSRRGRKADNTIDPAVQMQQPKSIGYGNYFKLKSNERLIQ